MTNDAKTVSDAGTAPEIVAFLTEATGLAFAFDNSGGNTNAFQTVVGRNGTRFLVSIVAGEDAETTWLSESEDWPHSILIGELDAGGCYAANSDFVLAERRDVRDLAPILADWARPGFSFSETP